MSPASTIEKSIKEKIEKAGTPLKDWDIQIYRGVLTGFNEAFIISTETLNEILKACKDDAERKRTEEIIRPILRGRDIKRYSYEWAGLYLIGTFPSRHYDIEKYPALKKYLLTFGKQKLAQTGEKNIDGIKDNNARKKTNNKWFETQDSISYWDDFYKQKIIFQEMVQEPTFCLDCDNHFFCLDTGRIIVGEKLEYLLCLLNSRIFFFAIKHFYGGGGLGDKGVRMKHTFFQHFPAYIPTEEEESYLKRCLSSISPTNIDDIDKFFYKKYGLSEEDILLIKDDIKCL